MAIRTFPFNTARMIGLPIDGHFIVDKDNVFHQKTCPFPVDIRLQAPEVTHLHRLFDCPNQINGWCRCVDPELLKEIGA